MLALSTRTAAGMARSFFFVLEVEEGGSSRFYLGITADACEAIRRFNLLLDHLDLEVG